MPKKMPGEAALRKKAEERQQRAKLMEIERHLREIRTSDDLSYSKNCELVAVQGESDRQLIDPEVLTRLVEQCRDEEERIGVMNDDEVQEVSESEANGKI